MRGKVQGVSGYAEQININKKLAVLITKRRAFHFKFSVKPFSKGLQVKGGALVALRRARNSPCAPSRLRPADGLELTSPPHAGGEVNSFSSQLSPKNPHSFGSEKDEGVKPTASGRFHSFRNAGGAPSLRSTRKVSPSADGDLRNFFEKSSLRIFKNFLAF